MNIVPWLSPAANCLSNGLATIAAPGFALAVDAQLGAAPASLPSGLADAATAKLSGPPFRAVTANLPGGRLGDATGNLLDARGRAPISGLATVMLVAPLASAAPAAPPNMPDVTSGSPTVMPETSAVLRASEASPGAKAIPTQPATPAPAPMLAQTPGSSDCDLGERAASVAERVVATDGEAPEAGDELPGDRPDSPQVNMIAVLPQPLAPAATLAPAVALVASQAPTMASSTENAPPEPIRATTPQSRPESARLRQHDMAGKPVPAQSSGSLSTGAPAAALASDATATPSPRDPGDSSTDAAPIAPAADPAEAPVLPAPAATGGVARQPDNFAQLIRTPIAPSPTQTPAKPAPPGSAPEIDASPGKIGRSLGIEIGHSIAKGEETLRVRLNPHELGRVEVTLAFDDSGSLRATVSAETQRALDLLRNDSGELGRALDQAGVRADAQSFRFESRTGGGSGHPGAQRHSNTPESNTAGVTDNERIAHEPDYRPLRSDGRIDLLA